nr:histidinol dehydrogenase [Bacilli bacterium]
MINRYNWQHTPDDLRQKLLQRASIDITEQMKTVLAICEDVRQRGDEALVDYTKRFDGVALTASQLRVSDEEVVSGVKQVDETMREVLTYAFSNIKKFHEAQMPEPIWMMEVDEGIMAGEKTTAIPDVALYVPRGKGSFPSVLLMLGVPAMVAGVSRIIVVTPPNEEGLIDPAILFAAQLVGIHEIYKVGGAQAIAAVAYGTQSVPKCAKVIGPGNPYVTAAKRLLMGAIDPGVMAGPSEAIILADEGADPKKVALDWMIEAEHGPDSASLLVTHSEQLADLVEQELEVLVASLKSPVRKEFVTTVMNRYGGIVVTASLEESIAFVNAYAPEHMEVMVRDPFAVLPKIQHAGEILLGEYTPITLCNFLMGPNAILPTGRNARTVSAVSVWDFMKRSSIGYVTQDGFMRIRDYAARFADVEGFETHAKAVRER